MSNCDKCDDACEITVSFYTADSGEEEFPHPIQIPCPWCDYDEFNEVYPDEGEDESVLG